MSSSDHMDVQAMLLDGARDFLGSMHALDRVRQRRAGSAGTDRGVWLAMAECGWLTMTLPEDMGGAALPTRVAGELAAMLGAALLPEPVAICGTGVASLLETCTESPLRKELQGRLADGSRLVGLAWQGAPGELQAAWHKVHAQGENGALLLQGMLLNAEAAADEHLVVGTMESAPVVLRVPADAPGLGLVVQRMADGSETVALSFERVRIARDQVLATGDAATRAMDAALADATLVLSAYLAGLAGAALAMTIEFLAQRKQFGQSIASFQAVRHRLVDLDLQRRLADASWRQACQRRAAALDEEAWVAISAAKARCADVALLVTRSAVQLHGAIGYTQEADIGLFLDVAMRHAPALGSASAHRRRVADSRIKAGLARAGGLRAGAAA